MSKSLKIILLAVGGSVGLLVIIAVTLIVFVDTDAYKPRLATIASQALGMEVSIDGRLGIGFFPGRLITLQDVHVRNRGADIASAKEARLGIDLLSLFHKEVRIKNIALQHPRIFIERERDGTFNFEKSAAVGASPPALGLLELSLSDATLIYADKQSGKGFEAGDCSLELPRLRVSHGQTPDIMKNLSFTGSLACGEIQTKRFAASDLKVSADGKDGLFDFMPIRMRVFGAQGSGSIRADFSGATPVYDVRYALPQFRIEEAFKVFSPQRVAEGTMDFSATLSMQGRTVHDMKQTLAGQVSLQGENITLIGRDLDQALARYESSQNFNLVDVGAFFFVGPLGLVVTKGYNFASIFQGSGGRSKIHKLVSDWKIEHGHAQAQDVAMATDENRIALQGRLDFVNERFDNVIVALIDAKGCAKVQQKMHGTFQKPAVEKPGMFQSLTGPARKLFNKGKDILSDGECDVFYTGSVQPNHL